MRASKIFLTVLTAVILCLPQMSIAGTSDVYALSNQTIMDRVDELQRSVEKQQQEIRHLRQKLDEQKAAAQSAREKDVAEIKEVVVEELRGQEVLPKWVKHARFGADVRLRQDFFEDQEIINAGTGVEEDIEDQNRTRLRLRFWGQGILSDEVTANFMLCTNADEKRGYKPKTSNIDWGAGWSQKDDVGVNRLFIEYKPNWLEGSTFGVGKYNLKNKLVHTRTTFDPDTNPEGVYALYKSKGGTVNPFIFGSYNRFGSWDNQKHSSVSMVQPGIDLKLPFGTWTIAGTYYHWSGLNNAYDGSTPIAQYAAGYGNSINDAYEYIYEYHIVQGITYLKLKPAFLGGLPLTLFVDYQQNVASHVPSDQDSIIAPGFQIGKAKKKGSWEFQYFYYNIEPDASIGYVNDSDLFGANVKGHYAYFKYMLLDNLMVRPRIFVITDVSKDMDAQFSDPATGDYGDGKNTHISNRVQIQFDIEAKF